MNAIQTLVRKGLCSLYGPAATRRRQPRHARLAVDCLEDRTLLSASPMDEIHLLLTPNDTRFGQQWDMTKISAPAAWDTTTGSRKVVVADIDSGIDYTHPDLYKNVWINQDEIPAANKAAIKTILGLGIADPITFWDLNSLSKPQWTTATIVDSTHDGRIDARDLLATPAKGGWADGADDGNGYLDDLVGWNFVANTNNPMDDNGHGTHTAGTIGAMGNNNLGVAGVNWQVQIMPLKFLASTGFGSFENAAAAITYAGNNGAQISNNSWGFRDIYETVNGTHISYLHAAIANSPQVLFVAAAGNDGLNNDTDTSRHYPASYNLDHIISVAATDSGDVKASFSNFGATTVDLAAPGVSVLSTVLRGKYANYNGTSMAAPHVAGAVALILAKYPSLDAGQLKSSILNGVDSVVSLSGKVLSGGRLNVAKALTAAATPAAASGNLATVSGSSGASGAGAALIQSQWEITAFDGFVLLTPWPMWNPPGAYSQSWVGVRPIAGIANSTTPLSQIIGHDGWAAETSAQAGSLVNSQANKLAVMPMFNSALIDELSAPTSRRPRE